MTPLFTSGEIEVTIRGQKIILRLTPRACALIEQKTGAASYMDAIGGIATGGDDGAIKPVASRCLAIFEALLEASKADPDIAEEVSTPDQMVIISKMLELHLRPVPEGAENPKMAAGNSTPVA